MSLRTRLLLATGAVALIALVVADIATYASLRRFLYDRVDQTLSTAFPPGPGPGPGGGGGPPPSVGTRAPGIFVERRASDGHVEFSYGAFEPGGRRYTPVLTPAMFGASPAGTRTFYTTPATTPGGPQFRVLVTVEPDGDRLVLGQPLDATTATLHQLFLVELAVTLAALVAATAVGVWLVTVGLRPLRRVEETAEAIAEGELERRVPGESERTEVGRLARVLNVMLGRIQQAFAQRDATEARLRASEERMRQFVADASHELRTPLSAVSAYAELYQRAGETHPEDLARIMGGIQGESARMGRLVEDLLLLARLDEGLPLRHEPVEMVALCAEAVAAARAVGPGWPVGLQASEPVEVVGDAGRLRQVLDNLLANVRAHTPEGTPATVGVHLEGDWVGLEVADEGPGIPDDALERLFERFYRADPSRARRSGGSGLGLSIVAAIVAGHGGRVAAANRRGGGVSITVRLPAAGAPSPPGSPADGPAEPVPAARGAAGVLGSDGH